MIVGVTQAEKAERAKQLTIFKATQGYDPEKWVKTKPRIRDESSHETDYNHIELVPHTIGKHRFAHCQTRYEQIHRFLGNRSWAQVPEDSQASGITWIELFVLYDIAGGRTEKGQYHKNLNATKRAEKRRRTSRNDRKSKGSLSDTTAVTKASLDEEIKDFKTIVRHIFKHEVKLAGGKWIRMENRTNLRRLNDLGIYGHQPAIKAYCQMSTEEKATIMEHILKQKVANNRKAEVIFAEHRQREMRRNDHKQADGCRDFNDDTILLRKARVAYGAPIRWKREMGKDESMGTHTKRMIPKTKVMSGTAADA